MVTKVIDVFIYSVLDDTCFWISFFLSLFLANITEIMLCPPMLGQVIWIVESFVVTKVTGQVICLLMLVILVPSVQLLLEKKDGLVLNTKLTVM